MGKEDFLKRNKEKVQVSLNSGSSPGRFQKFIAFIKSVKTLYVLIFFVSILILTLLAASFAFSEERYEAVPTCGDGTFYGKCSLDKSYYCSDGTLVERASFCGCPDGLKKLGEACSSEYHTGVRDLVLDYFFEGVTRDISFSVYEGGSDYARDISRVISYEGSEIKSRSDFNVRSLDDEIQESLIRPLVKEIQNLAPNNKVDQARIAVSIVQNIPYSHSNETFTFAGSEVDHSRYPYEVLYDYAGICGEKSELLAFLLRD
ncbi:MAG: hypothetical protein KKB79_03640, partial [Nanoarchaeota archaeon]|nr:hypothetical protein [Nanoarchaeota archaeon]